jgi:glycosyltransferase involved in cell wall biosynthesis
MKVIKGFSRPIIFINHARFDELKSYNGYKLIIFIILFWYNTFDSVSEIINYSNKHGHEVIILANTREEETFYKTKFTNDVLFMNHNAFIDENKFIIEDNIIKDYDLFVNSANEPYKRIHLSHLVDSVIYIRRRSPNMFTHSNKFSNISLHANFKDNILDQKNYRHLQETEISTLSNRALAGGIFSSVEGACFSSSQYLLCGLPVISTRCKGGREIWYTSDNSIYCDDTSESVAKCMEIVKQKLKDGSFNRQKIREDHIKLQDKFRDTLILYIIKKLNIDTSIYYDKLKKELSYR